MDTCWPGCKPPGRDRGPDLPVDLLDAVEPMRSGLLKLHRMSPQEQPIGLIRRQNAPPWPNGPFQTARMNSLPAGNRIPAARKLSRRGFNQAIEG